MSNNDFVRVEFGSPRKPNDQVIYKDLNSQSANIIGTSYKGPAFVPQIMFNANSLNGIDVKNTFINLLGTQRQNFRGHLYDEYTCYADSDAYDATSIWFANGGEYAYFTRVLGIGTGIKSESTGKMIGSGFNLSKNISSGTLDHKTSRYLNANSGGDPGCIGFVIRNITEKAKTNVAPDNSNPTSNIDYFNELGISDDANILTDVIMFASGVLPDLTTSTDNNQTYDTDAVAFDDIDSNYKTLSGYDQIFIKLRNFNPYFHPLKKTAGDTQVENKADNIVERKYNQNLSKAPSYTNNNINQFSERFFEKGHLKYASYPFCGFNANAFPPAKNVGILVSRDYETSFTDEEKLTLPDYNSFESEYQTAKTPWITSQPLNRPGIWIDTVESTNRLGIHKEVENLFRFWSLDDGEVGNRFRIKINITHRGDASVTSASNLDEDSYAKFDIYVFEYDPRVNDYLNMEIPDTEDIRTKGPVETFSNLNLNPNSKDYIGRRIGTEYTYYDFDADKIVTTGKYRVINNYLRVEIADKVENSDYIAQNNQHMLLPTGFRSYPHIELKKNAFKHYTDGNNKNIDLGDLFDTQNVYHLPPQYALNYYKDEALSSGSGIDNNWGVIFTPPMLDTNSSLFYQKRQYSSNGETNQKQSISPHFYYSKYFLSEVKEENKNVWVEEDNYLNSFFHLEKIAFKNSKDESGNLSSSFDSLYSNDNFNIRNMVYKHSGRSIVSNTAYEYLSLSSESIIWGENRSLDSKFSNKLSFDFFTYGGFDGVDIRDSDKRNLKNDAIIRELNDVDEVNSTYASYDKAIDIAVDSANSATDILVVPGIKEIPLIRKCINICEDTRSQFFIGDVSGACSNTLINFTNQTIVTNPDDVDAEVLPIYADTLVKTSLGVMGNHFLVDNVVAGYVRDIQLFRPSDDRFKLTDASIPSDSDQLSYYSYKSVLENQFDNIISLFPTYYIQSKYFFPVLGDTTAQSQSVKRKICPESFVLGLMASSSLRTDLTNLTSPNVSLSEDLSLSLINSRDMIESAATDGALPRFETNARKLKDTGINIIYKGSGAESIKLLSQNTSYDTRGSLFKDQGVVRTVQQIRKRIMFDIFLNQGLIAGGFFFSQNANLNNLYEKLDIQLKNLLTTFVQEGLITTFKVKIPKREDDQTLLDMQNYTLRGSIILQMNNSDTIDLTLNNILGDLSLLTDPESDIVLTPSI